MDSLKFLKKLVIAAGFLLAAVFYVKSEQSNTGSGAAILLENPAEDGGTDAGGLRAAAAESGGAVSGNLSAGAQAAVPGKQAIDVQQVVSAETNGNVQFASIDAAALARELAPLLPRCSCAVGSGGSLGAAGQENVPAPAGQQADVAATEQAGTANISAAQGQIGTELQLPAPSAQPDSSLINLNTASKEELMQLPGIGEAKADAIIRYRTEYGAFAHIEEVMNISGIKEAAFEKIKDSITV